MTGWNAEWISAEGSDGGREFEVVSFRRDVEIDDIPESLPVRISADSRYILWVNGIEIGRGPARAQPSSQSYDTYDLAPALHTGTNAVAVLVRYFGVSNAIWQRATVQSGLGSSASMILDAGAHHRDLGTGPGWRARRESAWSILPHAGKLASLPVEIVDFRRQYTGWQTSDPESMPLARLAEPAHPGRAGGSRPPVHPFGVLRERAIPPLTGARLSPVGVTRTLMSDEVDPEPIRGIRQAILQSAASSTSVSLPDDATVSEHESVLWQFDFGRVVSGLTELSLEAPDGLVVDLTYLERPLVDGAETRYLPNAGARLITKGGRTEYRSMETNGLRYAAVLVRGEGASDVRLNRILVHEQLGAFAPGAAFSSSDRELEQLWHAGVRTVQVNSVDAFTDCPTREQRAWVGDMVVGTSVHLVANRDWSQIARHIEISDSPRPDGILPMSVVGDIEADGGYTIPDWSLHWVNALWLYARATADDGFTRRHIRSVARILEWFDAYTGADGLVADVPEWVLIDWSSVSTPGISAALNALLVRARRQYAELSDWLGNHGDARQARAAVDAVESSFSVFWDDRRGVYVDHIVDGARMAAVSQASNAAAVVAGLVPEVHRAALIDRITDEARLVTRGWNAESPSVTLEQKILDRAAGIQRIDWDVENQIVRAEPFFSAVVHDAVAAAGRAELIPDLIRRWSRFLTDGYDTFGECWEWGTPCHGWSSTPTSDLVTHVLGVAPREIGADGITVAPARTAIAELGATVPTRSGVLTVRLADGVLSLTTPAPTRIRTWAGTVLDVPPGSHVVNMTASADDAESGENATRALVSTERGGL